MGLFEVNPSFSSSQESSYTSTYAPVSTNTDSRQWTQNYAPSYAIQIDSPSASMTKKDMASTQQNSAQNPAISPTITPSTSQSEGTKQGGTPAFDLTSIGMVAVLAAAAYFIVRK